MIKLRQPSLALHSVDVPGYLYQMRTTWKMPKGATANDVIYWINYAIDHASELELNNVLINCHGSPGKLWVGGSGTGAIPISAGDLGVFKGVRSGSLGTIYIVACEVTKGAGTVQIGKNFCTQLAINAGCFVVAADAIQSVDFWYQVFSHPFGSFDDYEGTVTEFGPSGSSQPWNPNDATGLQK